ncbi:hypothetical protein O6P43_006049 [Quillaja saponaria]|uniref:Uncharacterized protein n=1 Tax=Quillaja saponaria TaxID=32244 RepID=A0AAD7VI09_QUISA|nr:hypothetical protein O6P43_006049 [Quillaja saponaria]
MMVEVKRLASMESQRESVESRIDNMEARFIGLDSSLQDYKDSMDLSFQKLKLDMDSKFQTLMEAIALLRTSRMEDSTMPNLLTSLNEEDDGILKQKEFILSNFTGNHLNSPMIPQPLTPTAKVDEINIVAPPRTPRKEAIL